MRKRARESVCVSESCSSAANSYWLPMPEREREKERERERERVKGRETERGRERERVCVCVCAYMYWDGRGLGGWVRGSEKASSNHEGLNQRWKNILIGKRAVSPKENLNTVFLYLNETSSQRHGTWNRVSHPSRICNSMTHSCVT